MGEARLEVSRAQVLTYRRRVGALGERLPGTADGRRRAAWVGLQDSMPRAALLSLHARVADVGPDALDDDDLVQLWGPRYNVYVVAAEDRAVFTLGRLATNDRAHRRAVETADRVRDLLGDEEMRFGDVGRALGVNHNSLRYGAPTGTLLLSWDGARQPTLRVVPAPDVDPREARHELARRYLHTLGPTTAEHFASWAGVPKAHARTTFDEVADELVPVTTPVGAALALAEDEDALRSGTGAEAHVRLLPSGDAYWLLQDEERELLVPDPRRRDQLWTPRVWPGAVLLHGDVVGTWRRADATVTVESWRSLSAGDRAAVEAEAARLPLPGLDAAVEVVWGDAITGS